MSKDSLTYVVKDVDWTSKLVTAADCSPKTLTPLLQLKLHCEGRNDPLVFEFTPEEAQAFLKSMDSVQQQLLNQSTLEMNK